MNVLIVSDSHGLTNTLEDIKQRHTVSAMIHCGDSELDMDSDEMQGFYRVGGNVDFDNRYPAEESVELNDLNFYIAHGHLLKVNDGLLNVAYRARENDAQVVCFGHTHKAGAETIGSQLFINPGSIKQSRNDQKETYAIVSFTDASEIRVDFYHVDGSLNTTLSDTFHIDHSG